MALATDKQYIKAYGRLPWWRSPAHFQKLLKRSVVVSGQIEANRTIKKENEQSFSSFSQKVYSFASTQLDLPGNLQAKCRVWVLANVTAEDLSLLESQEDTFHVTVRYGLHDPDIRDVYAAVKGLGPVNIELGRIEQFEAEDYDVLIVPVIQHDRLLALRSVLSELPHTDTQPSYRPHVTLAYVQKGAGQRHVGDASFLGDTVTLDQLRYSDSKEDISWISLLPSSVPATSAISTGEEHYTSLHWTRDEAIALIHSVLAEHPDWNVDQIKREILRRRGILKSEILRRVYPVPGQEDSPSSVQYASDWVEEEHPREDNGQFAPKGTSEGGGSIPKTIPDIGSKQQLQAFAELPPAIQGEFGYFTHAVRTDAELNAISQEGIKLGSSGTIFASSSPLVRDRGAGFVVFRLPLDQMSDVIPGIDRVEANLQYPEVRFKQAIPREAIFRIVPQLTDKAGFRIRADELAQHILGGNLSKAEINDLPEAAKRWVKFSVTDPDNLTKQAIRKKQFTLDFVDLSLLLQEHFTHADQPELNRELTPYERKVDFAALDSETKTLASQGTERVRKLLAGSRDKLLALITSRHNAGTLTTKFVLDLELRGLGQLIPTLREVLSSSFRLGQREAGKELKKTFVQSIDSSADGGAKPAPSLDDLTSIALLVKDLVRKYPDWTRDQIKVEVQRRLKRARGPRVGGSFSYYASDWVEEEHPREDNGQFAPKGKGTSHDYQVKLHPEGLPPEKALEFFERKAVLWGADIRQPLLGDIKNILFDGIKQGTSLRDLMAQIGEVYLPWLGDPDQMISEQMLTPYRLETLVRTNITEALNEGRKAQYQSAVDDGFVIGLQYSAILDQRTTEVCRYLDQKVFEANSPELDRLTPPRHYNCRSVVVPITRMEGPVEYITHAQVAKGIELSGKGFSICREAIKSLEFDPSEPRDDKGQWVSNDPGGGSDSGSEVVSEASKVEAEKTIPPSYGEFAPVDGSSNAKSEDTIRAIGIGKSDRS